MEEGLVLWGVKNIYYVEDKEGNSFKCVIKGKKIDNGFDIKGKSETNPIVVGDRVLFEKIDSENGQIVKRLDRINEYKRIKQGGRVVQTLVSNIDLLIVVDSVVSPPFRPYFIDRCLFSADILKIKPLIVINKIDYFEGDIPQDFFEMVDIYKRLGYEYLLTSCKTDEGIDQLREIMKGKIVSFNGRSGVGKSSLVKKFVSVQDAEEIKVSEVSKKFNRGVHTTTFAKMYKTDFGARIIDTPGIREFSVFLDRVEEVEANFRDFEKYREKCKFHNCQHLNEPDCNVLQAVRSGKISPSRYESYLRIRDTIQYLEDSKLK